MTSIAEQFVKICERFPLIQIIQCGAILLTSVPITILLHAVQKSVLHPNCRVLLTLWGLSQFAHHVIVSYLILHAFVIDIYLPEDLYNPDNRHNIIAAMVFCVNSITCCELGISIERVVSIRKPAAYHISPLSIHWIAPFVGTTCLFSSAVGWLITHRVETTQAMAGALLNNVNDMVAFITSIFVVFHCRSKYMRIKYISKRTLNERYQIKEAYSVAKAMLPAYACNMLCKFLCMCCNWIYITGFHRLHGGYGVFEAIYVLLNIIVCGVGSSFFLMGHDQLRARLLKMMGRDVPTAVVPFQAPGEVTNTYFHSLNEYWN